jgi:cell division protein FtsL
MAAGAAARSAPATRAGAARTAPARRPRPQRRMSGPAVAAPRRASGVALPVRVLDAPFSRALRARTSSVLDALLSGRGWIVLIGVLLVGIVFFNVDLLRMNREIALTNEKSTALKRENARLRQEAALLGSSQRIQDAAAELGLVAPSAGDVRYLEAHPAFDARKAARSIVEPTDVAALPLPVTTTVPETSTTTPTVADTTTDPTATVPETTTPDPTLAVSETTAPTTTEPTTATPTAAAPAGGAVAPETTATP